MVQWQGERADGVVFDDRVLIAQQDFGRATARQAQ